MRRHPLFFASLTFVMPLLLLLTVATERRVLGQLTKIENQIPKSVPLKVEFKNYENENWWHDLEIKVTNTGKKPIFYLYLSLDTDRKGPNGNGFTFPLPFGDSRRLLSTDGVAAGDDAAILPGESYIFKISAIDAKAWDFAKTFDDFVEPRKAVLRHTWTNFGDGTGFKPGGTAFKKKL